MTQHVTTTYFRQDTQSPTAILPVDICWVVNALGSTVSDIPTLQARLASGEVLVAPMARFAMHREALEHTTALVGTGTRRPKATTTTKRIRIDTSQFLASHGAEPRQPYWSVACHWAFQIDSDETHVVIRAAYREALRQATQLAQSSVTVLP